MTNLPERFWSKVDKNGPGGCWLWTAAVRKRDGYGAFTMKVGPGADDRKTFKPHRLAYIDAGGDLPDGVPLDHLCRVRHCLNPAHLERVTIAENNRRGMLPTMVSKRTGVCFKGHDLTPENTYVKPKSGYRQCRICRDDYRRRYWQERAA